jgi:hypothetical protein
MPNRTLTDKHGNTYRLISNNWLKGLTALCMLNFVVLMLIIAGLIDNIRRVETTMQFTDKVDQRNKALGEIAGSRAKANIWAFEKTCNLWEKAGGRCMADPQWYADPNNYPLIVDDPMGAGLFPPK